MDGLDERILIWIVLGLSRYEIWVFLLSVKIFTHLPSTGFWVSRVFTESYHDLFVEYIFNTVSSQSLSGSKFSNDDCTGSIILRPEWWL